MCVESRCNSFHSICVPCWPYNHFQWTTFFDFALSYSSYEMLSTVNINIPAICLQLICSSEIHLYKHNMLRCKFEFRNYAIKYLQSTDFMRLINIAIRMQREKEWFDGLFFAIIKTM